MNLEFLSGFLLVLVVLGLVGYMARELFTDLRPGRLANNLRVALARQRAREAKPVNEHLIGTDGEVIANTDDDERPMKIRLGPEIWPARSDAPGENRFPVGARVEVTAIHGPLVIVRRAGSDTG